MLFPFFIGVESGALACLASVSAIYHHYHVEFDSISRQRATQMTNGNNIHTMRNIYISFSPIELQILFIQ